MQTLSQMSDTELLAWAQEFIGLECSSVIAKDKDNPLRSTPGAYPPNAIANIFAYGHQRKYNDGLGEVPMNEKLKIARDRMARFQAGDIGRTRGEAPDAFSVIVLRIVRSRVRAKNPTAYKKLAAEKDADKRFMAVLERARVSENPGQTKEYASIMAEATAERKHQEEKAALREESTLEVDSLL